MIAAVLVVVTGLVGAVALGAMSSPAAAAAQRNKKPARTTTTVKAPTTSPTTTVQQTTSTTAEVRNSTSTTTVGSATSPSTTTAPATSPTTAVVTAPSSSASTVLFGAGTQESSFTSFANLDAMESHAGKKASIYVTYRSFYWDPDFPTAHMTAIANKGKTPFMTWEPFNPSNGVNQPEYQLAKITRGDFDAMVNRWAVQIKAWNRPMYLRFASEMNGDWFPWSVGQNGNTAADYVAAYRHVHDIFKAKGVTNVKWVWNPNTLIGGAPINNMYPGDAYVDMVGIDGYNWGTSTSWGQWQSPAQVYGPTLAAVRAITSRPIIIGETSSAEAGGNKAQWITEFFSYLKANTDIKAFVWFNLNKETDWRIESSAAAQAAFAAGVSDSRVA